MTDEYSALDVVDAELKKGALNDAVDHFVNLKLQSICDGIFVIDALLAKRSFELAIRIAKVCEGGPAALLQRLESLGEHRIAQVAVEVRLRCVAAVVVCILVNSDRYNLTGRLIVVVVLVASFCKQLLAVREQFPALACPDYASPIPPERTWVADDSTFLFFLSLSLFLCHTLSVPFFRPCSCSLYLL